MVAAFEAALDDRDLLTRMGRFANAVEGLSPETLDESLALLVEKNSAVESTEVTAFMLAWSRFDPAGAFAWAQTGPVQWRKTLKSSAVYAWGYRKPHDAVEALDQLDTPEQQFLQGSLIQGWARSGDLQGVTDYVFSLEATKARMPLVSTMVAEVARGGIEATIAWADAIAADAPNAAKEAAFHRGLQFVTRNDAERAASWFELHQAEPYAARSIKMMAAVWIDNQDPPTLFAWLETLEPSEVRAAGMRVGFARWWENDPEAADAWIRSAELSAAHDPVIGVYAQQTSRSSPESAAEWIDRMHDESLRGRSIGPVLRVWVQQDPKAVRDWMNEHEVPPQVREAIESVPRYKRMERGIEEPEIERRKPGSRRRPRVQRGIGGVKQPQDEGADSESAEGESP